MAASRSRYSVTEARERFFSQGHGNGLPLPEPIRRSWERCFGSGLPADGNPDWDGLSGADFDLARERSRILVSAAEAEVDALHDQFAGQGATVILTDADGLILQSRGNPEFLQRAERVALRPGAYWNERQRGTNAVGTAIAERTAVEVRGGEHYLDRLGRLRCTATPLIDPEGAIAGVLDISCDARADMPQALAALQHVSQYIEQRLFDGRFAGHLVVRCHARPECLGTAREGRLVFAGDVLVAANRGGLALVGCRYADLGAVRFGDLFDLAAPPVAGGGRTVALRTTAGTVLQAVFVEPAAPRPRSAGRLAEFRHEPAPSRPTARPVPRDDRRFDPVTARQLGRAVRVLDAGLTVLVLGETGAGKEVFAREVYRRSNRSRGPFVALNCAAVPEGLIESELFGYEEGAFTGARRRGMTGKLREADGGVLFLDEIGDMPLPMQARLLRALQQREVTPLGSNRSFPVDIAVVCATHRDIEAMVAAGTFRADLYYRLNNFIVGLPSLRDRDDLPDLVDALFAAAGAAARGVRLAPAARGALLGYAWPGNLRQLDNVLRTLAVLADDGETVGLDALPPAVAAAASAGPVSVRMVSASPVSAADVPAPETLVSIERQRIDAALAFHGGDVAAAARSLGISRATLYRRLKANPPAARGRN